MTRAAQFGIGKKELAAKADISDIHLSNIQSKAKTWRMLTPDLARKLMHHLDFRSSQVNGVVEILEHFKQSRTRRKQLVRAMGLSKIDVQCEPVDTRDMHHMYLKLCGRQKDATVLLRIDCDSETVTFLDDKDKVMHGTKAAMQLLPRVPRTALRIFRKVDHVSLMLAAIMLSLHDQIWKAKASDLDSLDASSDVQRRLVRTHVLQGTWGLLRIALRAKTVFGQYVDNNRIASSR